MLQIEVLMAPIAGENPSGANLEYEAEFVAIEKAAIGKPEQVMGNSVIAAEPPNFQKLEQMASDLFGRSKDLRIAVHCARASLAVSGYSGLREGLELVSELLSAFWPTVHPELDDEDEDDPIMRISALSGLVSPEMLLGVRTASLASAKLGGEVSLRDHAVAAGELPQPTDEPAIDERSIAAVYREAKPDSLTTLLADVAACRNYIKNIEGIFQEKAGQSGPDLSLLDKLLHQAGVAVKPQLVDIPAVENSDESESDESAAAAAPVSIASSHVRSRADVMTLLDKICDYYDAYEPSSPLPLLLRRCQRLCNLSFKDIVKDLTPTAIKELDVIAGKEPVPGKK